MKTIEPDFLLAAIAEALETMAFIAIEHADDSPPADDPLLVSLGFSGNVNGRLTLCGPAALGASIAANLTAAELDSITEPQAHDALRELTNVTVGLLLRQICSLEEMPQLTIPIVAAADTTILPPPDCFAELSADGHRISLSLRTHE